jgi:hypothetical protein
MNAAYSPIGVSASAKSLIFIILLANFLERRQRELRRIPIPRNSVNKGGPNSSAIHWRMQYS